MPSEAKMMGLGVDSPLSKLKDPGCLHLLISSYTQFRERLLELSLSTTEVQEQRIFFEINVQSNYACWPLGPNKD